MCAIMHSVRVLWKKYCDKKQIETRNIFIVDDTYVFIISLAFFHGITNLNDLWITFGTWKVKRFISIYTIARGLGPEKCEALLGFHAITDCQSVSAFYGRGKKHAWDVWI